MIFNSARRVMFSVILVFLIIMLGSSVPAGADMAWLSGPAATWAAVTDPAASMTAMVASVQADFQNTLTDGTVTVNSLAPRLASAVGIPNVGCDVDYTVTGSTMTQMEIVAAIEGAPMVSTDNLFSLNKVYPIRIRVLTMLPSNVLPQMTATVALTGSSYFWTQVETSQTSAMEELFAPLEMDIQAKVDPQQMSYVISVLADTAMVNTSGFYVDYTAFELPRPTMELTNAEIFDAVLASNLSTFSPFMEKLVADTPALVDYTDLLPIPVELHEALYPNPDGSGSTNPTTVVREQVGRYILFFSGTRAGWQPALTAYGPLATRVLDDATAAITRSPYINSITVLSMNYVSNDNKRIDSMQVTVQVTQGLTGIAADPWSAEQVAAVLAEGDYGPTVDLYQPVNTQDESVLLSVGMDASFGLTCTHGCLGMILMGSVGGFLLLVTFVCVAIAVCCCCNLSPEEKNKMDDEERELMQRRTLKNPLVVPNGDTPVQ